MARFLNSGHARQSSRHRHDQIELFPQPSHHLLRVWVMISIDDCCDSEYADVRQDLEVDGRISPSATATGMAALTS
ncbi:MAG TPA: hypothetical protein VFW54_04235 [Propionibacteriaceae bacterium]|nr:hypothetical protein [Propionibacteriaceae bacterium]